MRGSGRAAVMGEVGAGGGNRTLDSSLGSSRITSILRPQVGGGKALKVCVQGQFLDNACAAGKIESGRRVVIGGDPASASDTFCLQLLLDYTSVGGRNRRG